MEVAQTYGHGGAIALLVEAGGNVNERDHKGRTALQYALFQRNSTRQFDTVLLLLQSQAHGNSSPGCGILDKVLGNLEGEAPARRRRLRYSNSTHRLHILLLRATLPLLSPDKVVRKNKLARSCLAVHQAHFRHARAVFVAARSTIQLCRSYFGGVDSPIAIALVSACSVEERTAAKALPLTAIHRPRFPVHWEDIQNETTLQASSNITNCEPVLNIEEAAERVARFAFDLTISRTALAANQRNQCGLNTALWYTYLNIPLSHDEN